MKLVIQIPCYNERDNLSATVRDLPRRLPGLDRIEVLVVDDGSTDGTAQEAQRLGVDEVVLLRPHRGLGGAFIAGLEACLRRGADLIVNTDGDHQYCGEDLEQLIAPLLAGTADIVIGDRRPATVSHFSWSKRLLQRLGTAIVRRLAQVDVQDATSGFRAFSRAAALRLYVHNHFTYTLETLLQAGAAGLRVVSVPVRTNPPVRPSRLFDTIPGYLRASIPTILNAYLMYRPMRTFGCLAAVLGIVGGLLVGRFLYFYLRDPSYSGHVQSLTVGVGFVVLSFLTGLTALLGELLACNRRLLETVLTKVRSLPCFLEGSSPPADMPCATGTECSTLGTGSAALNVEAAIPKRKD